MSDSKTEQSRIDALTTLRFVAASLIVVEHARGHFAVLDHLPEGFIWSQGITFFFVLSGFILTYVYPRLQLNSFTEIKGFLVKRVARIWPLHASIFFLRMLITPKALLTFPGAAPKLLVLFANLAMVHAWIPFYQFYFSYNAPSWTISTELFFYLSFPFLLFLANRRIWLPMLVTGILTIAAIFLANYLNPPLYSMDTISLRALLYINPLPRVFEFACGMTTALLFKRIKDIGAEGLSARGLSWKNTFYEVLALAATISLMIFTENIAELAASIWNIGPGGKFWLTYSGVPLAGFSLLIWVMAAQKGRVSLLLSAPILVLLGDISYALYLSHHPLLVYHGLYLSQFRGMPAFLLYCAILLVVSHLLYKLVETPARRFLVKALVPRNTRGEDEEESIPARSGTGLVEFLTRRLEDTRISLYRSLKGLKSKNSIRITAELALLAVLVVLSHPPLEKQTETIAAKLRAGDLLHEQVRAGDEIECTAVAIAPDRDCLEISWKSLKQQKIDQFISLQLLDKNGTKTFEQLVKLSSRDEFKGSDAQWVNRIELPHGQLDSVSTIGIIVTRLDQKYLALSGDKTDMDGKRMLVPLSSSLSGLAKGAGL